MSEQQQAGPYVLYYLGFGEDQRPVYVGITRTSIRRRLQSHLSDSRNPARRTAQPIIARVHREEERGRPVWLKALMEGLTEDAAKVQEVNVIRGLLRAGIALENGELRGKRGPTNRHPHGSLAYDEANRAYFREYARGRQATDPEFAEAHRVRSLKHSRATRATPEGRQAHRTGSLVAHALADLRKGRPLSPMRRHHIETAGRVEEARAILAARGEAWPEVDQG